MKECSKDSRHRQNIRAQKEQANILEKQANTLEEQNKFTSVLTLATLILAFGVLFNVFFKLFELVFIDNIFQKMNSTFDWVFSLGLMFLLIILLFLVVIWFKKKENKDDEKLFSSFKVKLFKLFFSKKCMDKKKDKLGYAIEFILSIIIPTIAIVWLAGATIEIVKMTSTNYLQFIEYAKISLTLFGFTLIGAVFEKKSLEKHHEIVKKLFHYSIIFLSSAIGFFILYSISFIPFERGVFLFDYIMPIVIFISMAAGYWGLIYGSLGLLKQLISYSRKL